MATTANKNCKQFIGIVTGEDGITARSGDEPGKGTVKLQTAEINESESTSSETVYQISNTGSTDVEVFNYTDLTFAENDKVEIWQDGYGVFWVTPTKDYREYFVIENSDNVTAYAKKGNVFYISRGTYGVDSIPCWRIRPNNSDPSRLAICQEDMPDDYLIRDGGSHERFFMPYYTPEMNYGIKPNVGSISTADSLVSYRGVVAGEYEFSVKKLDYTYQSGKYSYNPRFLYTGQAVNLNGGVGITIEGHTYPVVFPTSLSVNAGYSLTSYPDVYAGDIITVLVTDTGNTAYSAYVTAVSYPTDFEKGFSIVVENSNTLGRGWDEEYIQGTDFKFIWKISGQNCLTPPPQ